MGSALQLTNQKITGLSSRPWPGEGQEPLWNLPVSIYSAAGAGSADEGSSDFPGSFQSSLTSHKSHSAAILPLWFVREAAVILQPLNSRAKWLDITTR